MILLVTIVATLLPVGYYIVVGLRKSSRPETLDDYFIYSRKVTANDFANTTVGYSLQMAALFLFADWGIRYGLGAFWVPLFWAVGFWLLYKFIPTFDRFVVNNWTLHGYLRNAFDSRAVQLLASAATIIGLWGTMMVEIDYATSIYQPFFAAGTQMPLYVLGMTLLAFGFVYIVYGGYKAEVNTERLQVPIAYSMILVVLLVMIQNVYARGYTVEFWILNLFLIICFLFLIKAKSHIVPGQRFADWQIFIPIVGIVLQVVLILVSLFHIHPGVPLVITDSLDMPLRAQARAQGLIGLVSLFFANAIWQFVDISSWQRISSVKLGEASDENRYAPLRRGLWRVMIESPVTWVFGIILGMTLKYSGFLQNGDDPSLGITNFVGALVNQKASLGLLESSSWLLYPVLVAAVIAIMLSTIDALISAIAFTSYHDLPPYTTEKSLYAARVWTAIIVGAGGMLYYFIKHVSHLDIPTLLYAFYSGQVALFPTIVATFCTTRLNKYAALSSISLGIVVAFVTAFTIASNPQFAVTPPFFALTASAAAYVSVSAIVRRGSKEGAGTNG